MASLKMLMIVVALPAMASAAVLADSKKHYKEDCGTKSHLRMKPGAVAMLQASKDNKPGAGIAPFEPYDVVLKDGFMPTDCIKDYMYYRGDKFGDNKFDYKLGPVSNVSIVHYDEVVAKEDQQEMTQEVCFEFCRTVPDMGFFGIVNGRNCYCTPYFQAMASDSSECDAVCEGKKTTMCGGKSKSSIFTMHKCGDTAAVLQEQVDGVIEQLSGAPGTFAFLTGMVAALHKHLDQGAAPLKAMFSMVGDSGASNMAQDGLVWSGTLQHSAEDAAKIMAKLHGLADQAAKLHNADFTKPEVLGDAEHIMSEIEQTGAMADVAADELTKQIQMTYLDESTVQKDVYKTYYGALYFVDKKFGDDTSTCTGDVVKETAPMIGTLDQCATACDNHIHDCVGFQFFDYACVLLSNFKTVTQYSNCESAANTDKVIELRQKVAAENFLQQKKEAQKQPFHIKCYAKFSKFEGTSLKPDGSGKCKQCFKDLTKRDKCPWEYLSPAALSALTKVAEEEEAAAHDMK